MNSIISLARASLIVALAASPSSAGHAQSQPKPATEATKAANRELQQRLNFNDREDFDNATRGLIAKPDTLTIKDAKGNVVWDLEATRPSSASISRRRTPSTRACGATRSSTCSTGLFKVHDRIFQVRGYDLSNITFIQGDTRLDRVRSADLG